MKRIATILAVLSLVAFVGSAFAEDKKSAGCTPSSNCGCVNSGAADASKPGSFDDFLKRTQQVAP